MNEKEYQTYDAKYRDDRWDKATDCIVMADIARQLTRIADAHEPLQIMKKAMTHGIPAPDALVEAGNKMAEFLATWEDTLAGKQMTQEDFDVDCGLSEWKKALAAHKKAGG
jgi:acyl-CoA synthetase (NDP forming)